MEEKKEIRISNEQVIAEINVIQSYIKTKGMDVTHTEIVQACIRLAKRLSAEDWGIYLEIKHVHNYASKNDIYKGIVKHINKLGEGEKVDAQKISDELGCKKENVDKVLNEIF